MFDKRLIALVPGVMRPIVASVVAKVAALAFNILIILTLGDCVAALVAAGSRGAMSAAGLGAFVSPGQLGVLGLSIVGRAVAIYAAQRAGDKAAYLAKREVRQRVYDKLAALGPAYAEHASTAEAVQTSAEGAQQLEVYFGGYLPQLFYAVLAPITLFCVLVGRAPVPATVLLVIVPLIPASIMMVMKNAKKVAAEYWGSYVDLGGSFLEAVQGLTTLKIYRADARWHERMNREAEGFRRATMKMLGVQLNSINVMDLVAFGGAAAGIILAVVELACGRIGFAAAFSVVFLSQEFFLPMRRLGSLFHTAMNGMSAAKTMFRILDAAEPARGDVVLADVVAARKDGATGDADGAAATGALGVELEGVGYAYGEHVVLEGVDARIPAGSFTALVGESGSGKSTLAGILSGRKGAYRGEVRVAGVPLREVSLASLTDTVTLVSSSAHLFAGTVRENLLLGCAGASDDDMWAALAAVRLDGFVRAGGGLDLAVAEGGQNLSGGQRQRLAVARALLHKTPIYIFDEATSNVDVESEHAIGAVMERLAGEHTVIVIAHRLASVERADQILVMDRGRLVEQGDHAALLAAEGRYAQMWRAQAELSAYAVGEDVAAGDAVDAEVGDPSATRACARSAQDDEGGGSVAAAGNAAVAEVGDPSTTRACALSARDDEGAGAVDALDNEGDGASRHPERSAVRRGVEGSPAAPAGRRRSAFSIMMHMIGLVRPLLPYLVLAVVLGSLGSLAATFVVGFGAMGLMDAMGSNMLVTLARGAAALAGVGPVGAGLTGSVILTCVCIAACGVVRGPLHYGEQLANHYIAFRLLAHIRDLVFAQLRRLAPAKLEGRERGDLISLVTADIELLEVFYAHTISPIAIALVTCAVMLVFIGLHAPVLAGVAAVTYLLLGVVLPIASSKLCGSAGRASRDGAGAISAYVLDSLRGLAESIQYGNVAARSRGLEERTRRMGGVDRRLHVRMAAVEAVADALVLVCSLGMIAVAASQVIAGVITVRAAFVASFTFFSSFGPVLAVARLGTSLQATLASGARVLDLLDEEPQTIDVADGEGVMLGTDDFSGAAVEGVSFAYGAEQILDDVTLALPAGQMTCITGRSGSGKSTLLKLLMRFWDASAGVVRVGGHDVRRVATSSLRACEAYMTQDTHLFVGTLRDNLLVAREDASEAQLAAALEAAALTELVERLPQGLDTPVAELGDSLSGGERQRLGLARVFLSDAPFVLLDEPTSNLDALNEAAVMRAVARLREAGKTVVLVSHRASTCAFADAFYSVERGRLS